MKKIKVIIFTLLLITLLGIYIYVRYKPYNYVVNYVVNNFEIEESYSIRDKEYTIYIKKNDKTFPYNIKQNYIGTKELINDIKIYEYENEICIFPFSDKINFYPLCSNNLEYTFYNLSNQKISGFEYQKPNIYELQHNKFKINYIKNNSYLFYNYNSFYYIKDNKINEIKIFDKDHYKLDLVYQLNEYILLPDYDNDYYFNKFYIINMKNGKLKEIEFKDRISFNSIFLGDYKNNIYLLDIKEEKEYLININKNQIQEIEFTILQDQKLRKVSFKEIINQNLVFDNKIQEKYKITNNKLYYEINDYKILVTNTLVDKIVKIDRDNNTVYYLSQENLYMFNNLYGEILLASNFEWNFNNTNVIFIY